MGVEIERKFLLAGDGWRSLGVAVSMRQGYLSSDKARVVRVRIEGDHAYITIKGKSVGATRGEWEYPVPVADAQELLLLCQQPLVEKVRRRIDVAGRTWEVDEFSGANKGLIVAEIELSSEDEVFDKPAWIGDEVTEDARYYNSSLVSKPFTEW